MSLPKIVRRPRPFWFPEARFARQGSRGDDSLRPQNSRLVDQLVKDGVHIGLHLCERLVETLQSHHHLQRPLQASTGAVHAAVPRSPRLQSLACLVKPMLFQGLPECDPRSPGPPRPDHSFMLSELMQRHAPPQGPRISVVVHMLNLGSERMGRGVQVSFSDRRDEGFGGISQDAKLPLCGKVLVHHGGQRTIRPTSGN